MDKRIKWTLLTLLGFSTACGTVKHRTNRPEEPVSIEIDPRAVAMYGVMAPVSLEEIERIERGAPLPVMEAPDTLPAELERPRIVPMYGVRMRTLEEVQAEEERLRREAAEQQSVE